MDRRVRPLMERFRKGLWKAHERRFEDIKWDDPLRWDGMDLARTIDALEDEAKRYSFTKNGVRCSPRDVLYDIVPRFRDRVQHPRQAYDNQAVYVIEAIAASVFREYEVAMLERRLDERRIDDRRAGLEAGCNLEGSPQDRPSGPAAKKQ